MNEKTMSQASESVPEASAATERVESVDKVFEPVSDRAPGVASSPLEVDASPRRARRAWIAIALIVVGIVLWQWIEIRQRVIGMQEEVASRLAESGAQDKVLRETASQIQEATQAMQSRLQLLESRLADYQGQQVGLEGLYQDLARGRDEWMLSEVDRLIGLAVQQLRFFGDVQSAVLALNNADAQLAGSERPQFAALRKAIGLDLQRLNGVPLVDLNALSSKIEDVVHAVDQMPLAFDARPGADGGTGAESVEGQEMQGPLPIWERFALELWSEVKGLVRVERLDRPESEFVSASNAIFLRENLKLRLLNARLSLVVRDQATFRGEIKRSLQWIERFFDSRDRNVMAAVEAIRPMLGIEVVLGMPDLSRSQSELHNLKASRERKETVAP